MPIWLLAIVVAGAAPMLVRYFADHLVATRRARTEEALRKARSLVKDRALRDESGDDVAVETIGVGGASLASWSERGRSTR